MNRISYYYDQDRKCLNTKAKSTVNYLTFSAEIGFL